MLSPRILRRTLLQSAIAPRKRRPWADAFVFGSSAWSLFGQVGEPRACPPTRDPVLLALRRLAWLQLGELGAMHRVAALEAAERPYGFLRLVLEEAAALDIPAGSADVLRDKAFKVFAALTKKDESLIHQQEHADLRLRGTIYTVRRQLVCGDPNRSFFIADADALVANARHKDPELEPLLLETQAMVAELEGRAEQSIDLHQNALKRLFATVPDPADRRAEMMVDLADRMRRQGRPRQAVEIYYDLAATLLASMPPQLNQPLRRRLAAFGS